MAVPPTSRSQQAAASGPSVSPAWYVSSSLFDIALGALFLVALPLAVVTVPNTVSVVGGLLPEGVDQVDLMRAQGLSVPATMLTVPLIAVLSRRVKVAQLLLGGLALLAVADALGGFAGSTFTVGVLRVLHGVGAGVLVPATLVAAWERGPVLRALWVGVFVASLLSAQALALWPLDGATDWRITLQPYPLVTGVALALAAGCSVLWVLRGENGPPRTQGVECSRLAVSAAPAAGIAALAVGSTYSDWGELLVVAAAVLSILALLALASVGDREGRTLAYVVVAVGAVLLPTAAQSTMVELGGVGGPGLLGLWLPFLLAAGCAAGAAVWAGGYGGAMRRWLVPTGLLSVVMGLCGIRVMVPSADGFWLVVPFALLAVGAAVALVGALRQTGIGSALFALTLCFPSVLAGYLFGTGVQVMRLRGSRSAQELVDNFVSALHSWALVGGFLVVLVILLASFLARGPGMVTEEVGGAGEFDGVETAGSAVFAKPYKARPHERGALFDTVKNPGGREMATVAAQPEPGAEKNAEAVAKAVARAAEVDKAEVDAEAGKESAAGAKNGEEPGPRESAVRRDSVVRREAKSEADEASPMGAVPVIPPPAQSPEDSL